MVKEKFGRFDIENSMLKIKDAEDLYNSAKYKEAVDLLKQIIQELKTAAVKSEFVDLEKQEEEISNEILEKGKAGFIVTEGEILFKNALAAHQSKNFVEVISLLKEARKALALARRKAPEGLDERIKETVKLVETKKEAGLKVDELFIVLQKVQEAFAADKFVEVQNLIDFINKQIAALEGKKIEKKIEITLGDIKYLQKEAIISGIINNGASDILVNGVKRATSDDAGSFRIVEKQELKDKQLKIQAVAKDGKKSSEVQVVVKAIEDIKPPVLVVSSPEYTANTVKIKGFAEDDIELKAIRINGELLNFDARGIFEKILVMDEKLQSALVEAEDGSGKKTTVVVTLQDNLAPVVDVISAVIENGRAILEVRATDNIALQEITINGQPIAMTLPPTGGVFKYTIAINKDMIKVDGGKEIVELKVKALDKAGLLSEKIAKAELPPDVNAPELVWDVRLEGNLVVVKGLATDNKPNDRGIASLKINGEQVRIFDNGAFERTFEVKVKPPVLRIVETVI
ncbi:MAG TPA: hypothetical protein PLM75_12140, partial [bacterium]|nr:hypothetical protein [bacterium]